jgi:hydrogenase maturation protease
MVEEKPAKKPKRIVVLGLGNLLLGDEGAGVRVIHRLRRTGEPGNVELIDGGTAGYQLLEFFDQADLVVVADAARDGRRPGTVTRLTPVFGPGYPPTLLPHDIGLKNLLDALTLLEKKPEIVMFTISVAAIERASLDLSPEVERGVRSAADQIRDFLLSAQR